MEIDFNILIAMIVDLKSRIQMVYERDYSIPRSLHLLLQDFSDCIRQIEEYVYTQRGKESKQLLKERYIDGD